MSDLANVDPVTAMVKPTTGGMPRSAIDGGVVTQEQASQLFTGTARRVTTALGRGRRVQLRMSHHAVDPILSDDLAEANIDLTDGRLAFALPAAMEITTPWSCSTPTPRIRRTFSGSPAQPARLVQ